MAEDKVFLAPLAMTFL